MNIHSVWFLLNARCGLAGLARINHEIVPYTGLVWGGGGPKVANLCKSDGGPRGGSRRGSLGGGGAHTLVGGGAQ